MAEAVSAGNAVSPRELRQPIAVAATKAWGYGSPVALRLPGTAACVGTSYRPVFFRHAAKSFSVCSSVAG